MVIITYLDDSADQTQEKVVVYAGFMGDAPRWNALCQMWNKRLRADGIKYFRSTECRSLRGEFAKFKSPLEYPPPKGREAAKRLREDLKEIVKASKVMGMAVGVLVRDYKEVLQLAISKGKMNADPSEAAYQSLIIEYAKAALRLGKTNRIAYICDQSTASSRLKEIYLELIKKNHSCARIMTGGISYQDDKHFPQLQAADLIAGIAKDMLLEQIESGKRPELRELRECIHQIAYWNREIMLAVLASQ